MRPSSLNRRAFLGVAQFIFGLVLLIFLPAWTVRFWQGWTYVAVFSVCIVAITVDLARQDPALLERRLQAGPTAEQQSSQRRIQAFASVMLCALFIVAALDHRWHWSPPLSTILALTADALVVLGFAIIFLTFRENSHASGIVGVEAGQRVIGTGPYGLVRHPMYAGAALLFVVTPVALGSWWAEVPAVLLCATLVVRLLDEERYLSTHLSDYSSYLRQVRFRLLPGIW